MEKLKVGARIGMSLLEVLSTTGMDKKLNSLSKPASLGKTCTLTERAVRTALFRLSIAVLPAMMVKEKMKALTCSWMRPMENRLKLSLSTLIKTTLNPTRSRRYSSSILRFSSTTTSGWTVELLRTWKDSWTQAQFRLPAIKKHLSESCSGKTRGVWTCSALSLMATTIPEESQTRIMNLSRLSIQKDQIPMRLSARLLSQTLAPSSI